MCSVLNNVERTHRLNLPDWSMLSLTNRLVWFQAKELLPSVSTIESVKSDFAPKRVTRLRKENIPKSVCHFTLSYEEWHAFYQRKTGQVVKEWGTDLNKYIGRTNVKCPIAFKEHHVRAKNSRKRNCNIFSCHGHCTEQRCPVRLSVTVQDGPKKQGDPVVFNVYVYYERKHEGTAQRPLTGVRRAVMGKFANLIPHLKILSF